MKKTFNAKRVATLGVFTSLSLLMFMVENLLPSLVLPGAKIGLSNIFTMLSLFLLGPIDAIILISARTVLGSLITGSLSTLMFSLPAGLISVIVSILLYLYAFPKVSIIAISIISAVVHNVVQTAVFCLITGTFEYFSFLVYLVAIGIGAGLVVGVITLLLIKYIPKNFMEKLL
jgi:heptaprenyl diphosphate synthase